MKNSYLILVITLSTMLASCDGFLQRDPIDFGDDQAFLKSADDMRNYTNTFYSLFPSMKSGSWGGIYADDNNSDNQAGSSANTLFYKGDKYTPLLKESQWSFDNIRNLNYFINRMNVDIPAGKVSGSVDLINQYMGEAYFFKAYEYFRLLSTIGDVPILDKVYGDNYEELVEASKRAPRNEVARYILRMLDKSTQLMLNTAPETGRLSKDAAMLLKARVALFEATWEKYHQGTALVPGNPKWVGAAYHPNFAFAGGNIESEYNYFFERAIGAADSVASKHTLYKDYPALFTDNTGSVMASSEVILARFYKQGVNGHSATHFLNRTGAGTGLTRAMVETFLTSSGLPIYADSNYGGDEIMHTMLMNRDKRLSSSVKTGGFVMNGADTVVFYKPFIYYSGNQGTSTGYELKKWSSTELGQDLNTTSGTTATPIFRAAEAYLIYMEAYYERFGNLDGNCNTFWKALRTRAGVNENYQATIAATNLLLENDLATMSRSVFVDATLYNIRRERRSEFVAEGMRLMDLKRWRSLDHMVNYQVEGLNLWADIYSLYSPNELRVGETVSSSSLSTYLRPFQIVSSSIAYNGYTFPKPHYLEAIPVSEIIMTTINGQKSTIYQNPGWPSKTTGLADYSYDCD